MPSLYVASFEESDTTLQELARDKAKQQHPSYSELHAFEANELFAKEVYAEIETDDKIDRYLAQSRYYSVVGKRWSLPQAQPGKNVEERDLYKPLGYIFDEIVAHFYHKKDQERTRAVVRIHKKELVHSEDEGRAPRVFSQPDFMVTATGPAFRNPAKDLTTGNYDCAAGLIDVKVEDGLCLEQDLKQLAVYARQLFAHQPQRRYARILIVTEKRVRIYHFDRSGAQYSPLLDYHKDPKAFVRLVLGITSLDEETLGFDTSVYWDKDKQGKPVRYIKVVVGEGEKKQTDLYQLIPGQEPFTRKSIRGRGTTGWYAQKGDRKFLIKDSWRSASRTPEHEFLEAAKGIDGIGQMVSYWEGPHTREYRGSAVDSYKAFRDRIFCRIVMDLYGGSLDTFETVEQVLAAIRDAVAGHRALLLRGVLHRDVSLQNILLGLVDTLGKRGLLIDLDLAKFIDRDGANGLADFRIGTRMFQSLMVLESFSLEKYAPEHDHLDDLESFVYVFAYLVWTFEQPGVQKPKPPQWLIKWGHEDPREAWSAKKNVMFENRLHGKYMRQISDFWGAPCRVLICELQRIVHSIASQKSEIANDAADGADVPDYTHLRYNQDGSHKYYDEILDLFDKAIEAVQAEAVLKAEAEDAQEEIEEKLVPSPPTATTDDQEQTQEQITRESTPLHLVGNISRSYASKRTSADQADADEMPLLKRLRTLSGSVAALNEDEEEGKGEEQEANAEECVAT
ncbi:hypothetical protein MD484_g495, partial [Candolleomyces efflorescens]